MIYAIVFCFISNGECRFPDNGPKFYRSAEECKATADVMNKLNETGVHWTCFSKSSPWQEVK